MRFYTQANADRPEINVFSRTVYLTLIARRSRYHAGVRFLTRGADEYVGEAPVPVLIIAGQRSQRSRNRTNVGTAFSASADGSVSEPLATPFGYPVNRVAGADYGGYTSFVQIRGSIPVMWHQMSDKMTPKPPIESKLKTTAIR